VLHSTLRRWSGTAGIVSGFAIVSLFLARPTGSFWPISLQNITLTIAVLLLPWTVAGIYLPSTKQRTSTFNVGLLLAPIGASMILVGYTLLSIMSVYPPTGWSWTAFVFGFLLLGIGLLFTVIVARSLPSRMRWGLFAVGVTSSMIFLSAELLGAYPFPAELWSAFGLSLIFLGYAVTSRLG
jgi:hypothetical protein